MKPSPGRPALGSHTPISVTLTDAQHRWIGTNCPDGMPITQFIRNMVDQYIELAPLRAAVAAIKPKARAKKP